MIEGSQGPSGSGPPKRAPKKGKDRARDDKGRYIKVKAKEPFSIDEAARQIARDSTPRDLVELAEELAKTATVTLGGFPVSPQKGSSSKATVAAPAGDPNSVLNRPVRPSLGEDGTDYGS